MSSEQALSKRVYATVRRMDLASMDALLAELQQLDQPDLDGLIAYVNGGRVFLSGAYAEATKYFEEALGAFRSIGDREGQNVAYGMLAITYVHTSQFAEGYAVLNRALDLAIERDDQRRIAWCYQNIGTIMADVFEHERALEYNLKAEAQFKQLGDGLGVVHTLYQRSIILASLGRMKKLWTQRSKPSRTRQRRRIPPSGRTCRSTWPTSMGMPDVSMTWIAPWRPLTLRRSRSSDRYSRIAP